MKNYSTSFQNDKAYNTKETKMFNHYTLLEESILAGYEIGG